MTSVGSRPTALVTGAAGWLGAQLALRLLAEDLDVVGLDAPGTEASPSLAAAERDPRFQRVVGPLGAVPPRRVDLVFHLAELGSSEATNAPYATMTRCVLAARDVVEWARGGAATLVVATALDDTTTEGLAAHACVPAAHRLAAAVFLDARARWNLDVRWLRLAEGYGPGMPLAGEGLVARALRAVLAGEALAEPHQRGAPCHVDDLVESLVRAATVERVAPLDVVGPQSVTAEGVAQALRALRDGDPAPGLPGADATLHAMAREELRDALAFAPERPLAAGLAALLPDARARLGCAPSSSTGAPTSRALARLVGALPGYLERVSACGDAYRIGDRMTASEGMIAVSEALSAVHDALATAARERPDRPELAELDGHLCAHVAALGEAQAEGDAVRLADLLEHELLPWLAGCRTQALAG